MKLCFTTLGCLDWTLVRIVQKAVEFGYAGVDFRGLRGDLPLARFYALLAGSGYDGWYTLGWERKWHPEIEPPEVAFPHFVEVMRRIEAEETKQA